MARIGDRRGTYSVLVGRPERKRPLGRPTCRWEHNIKMNIQEWDGEALTECTGSGQGQVAVACKCGSEPSGSVKCGEFLD